MDSRYWQGLNGINIDYGIDNTHAIDLDWWYRIGTPKSHTYERTKCCPYAIEKIDLQVLWSVGLEPLKDNPKREAHGKCLFKRVGLYRLNVNSNYIKVTTFIKQWIKLETGPVGCYATLNKTGQKTLLHHCSLYLIVQPWKLTLFGRLRQRQGYFTNIEVNIKLRLP